MSEEEHRKALLQKVFSYTPCKETYFNVLWKADREPCHVLHFLSKQSLVLAILVASFCGHKKTTNLSSLLSHCRIVQILIVKQENPDIISREQATLRDVNQDSKCVYV